MKPWTAIANGANHTQGLLVALVANAAPWVTPLPTAWLVYDRTQQHLGWPWYVAAIAGITLELLGVGILATWLELYGYNRDKRKSDPAAPMWLPILLVVLYIITAEALTVVLDVWPPSATIAPALFPVLSVAAFALLALRANHRRTLDAIEQQKAESRAMRQRNKAKAAQHQVEPRIAHDVTMQRMTKSEQVRRLAELHPDWIPARLAQEVPCSPSTVTRALRNGRKEPITEEVSHEL